MIESSYKVITKVISIKHFNLNIPTDHRSMSEHITRVFILDFCPTFASVVIILFYSENFYDNSIYVYDYAKPVDDDDDGDGATDYWDAPQGKRRRRFYARAFFSNHEQLLRVFTYAVRFR